MTEPQKVELKTQKSDAGSGLDFLGARIRFSGEGVSRAAERSVSNDRIHNLTEDILTDAEMRREDGAHAIRYHGKIRWILSASTP